MNQFLTKNYKDALKSELILLQIRKLKHPKLQKQKMKLYEQYWEEKKLEQKSTGGNTLTALLQNVCKHFTDTQSAEN